MEVFQFSKKRARKIDQSPRTKITPVKKETGEPAISEMFVQGKKATAPEWRVAQALNKLEMKYTFQYSILGGRMSGGQMLDFFVYTVPLPTPINVQGEYWHRSTKNYADALKQNRANEVLGGRANQLVLLWERNLKSVDDAYKQLRENLGGI